MTAAEGAAADGTSDSAIIGVLRGVMDPELHDNIVDLGMVRSAQREGTIAHITIALTTAGCPLRATIKRDCETRVKSLPGIESVKFTWDELNAAEKARVMERARAHAREVAPPTQVPPGTRVLAIASGKGGVGKSSVTVNLAAGLARRGFTVGVLDADIWGFSVPRMLGVQGRLEARRAGGETAGAEVGGAEAKIVPSQIVVAPDGTRTAADPADTNEANQSQSNQNQPNQTEPKPGLLKVVSTGLLLDNEEKALMWRGLMLAKAVEQFLNDVAWGQLDYLLIDMPPGTGDVQMALSRMLPQAEMLVVTTPALSAQKVAVRVADMARRSHMPIIGVIENMSAFVAPDGQRYELFGSGGGQRLADDLGAPLIGQIPLEQSISTGGDEGAPVTLGLSAEAAPSPSPAAKVFDSVIDCLIEEIAPPIDLAGCSAYETLGDSLVRIDFP